ncbi:MAG: type II secretion system GspH family protein [Planctomycetaceae bacterium]|nr:type II secretion system GspH family protein [Planctomycetaceae bacterium]
MRRASRRDAFTLIEVLIVVIIMAVLAATIIPQFSSSTNDAKLSSLKFNLHTIRSQIEMYKVHHSSTVPTLANFTDQMTKATNVSGQTGTSGTSYPYGPYFQGEVPANPFNSLNTLSTTSATNDTEAKAAADDTSSGWLYNPSTGDFFPNWKDYYTSTGTTSG